MFSIFKKKEIKQSGMEMAEEGLQHIALAVKSGSVALEKGRLSPNLYAHLDTPNGTPRITYVMLSPGDETKVIARCVLLLDRTEGNRSVWQMECAVLGPERSKGVGRRLVEQSLVEFEAGMKGKLKSGYFIEAIVDDGNIASNKIANFCIGGKEKVKDPSGASVNSYLKRV